jgi:hypothetical protein
MALTTTNAQISITDAAGAVVNASSNAILAFTPGSLVTFALQSPAGVQRWTLLFNCPAYPSLHLSKFEVIPGQQPNLIQIAMPAYPVITGAQSLNTIQMTSVISDGVSSIAQAYYTLQSLGATVVPMCRSARCIVSLGQGGLAGTGYTAASGVLTASSNGAWTNSNSDSIAIAVGDRVLCCGAGVNNTDNGIFQVTSLGSAGTPWVLTRAPDMAQGAILPAGTTVEVSEGTIFPNTTWKDLLTGSKTIGTTNMAAAWFPSRTIGAVALSSGTPSTATVSNLYVATPLGSTAPGPGVVCMLTEFTNQANATLKGVLTAGNGNGSLAITGAATNTDKINYVVINW